MTKRSPLLPIFLIVLVDVFGLTLVIPLLSFYAEKFRATPLEATLLQSVYAACGLISGPLIGKISDRVGRKPMLFVSQVGTFLGFLLMARAGSLWMLYVARVIDGATAGNLSLAQAYISDNTEPERRVRAFGFIGIAFGLGFFIGPALTGYLTRYGLAAPIYAAAGLSALSILGTLTLLPGGRPTHPAAAESPGPAGKRLSVFSLHVYGQYFRRPVLGGMLLQFFFYAFCFSTFTSGFALFSERVFQWRGHPFGPAEVGFGFAYAGFLGIILQGGLIGRLSDRFGEAAMVSAGFASLVVAYLALGLIHGIVLLVCVATVASFGNSVIRPVLTSLVSRRAGRNEQGVVLGLNQSLMLLATVLAPALSGYLIGERRLTGWACVAGFTALLGLIAGRWGSSLARAPNPHELREASGPAQVRRDSA